MTYMYKWVLLSPPPSAEATEELPVPRGPHSLFRVGGNVFLAPLLLDLRMHAPHAAIQAGFSSMVLVFRLLGNK